MIAAAELESLALNNSCTHACGGIGDSASRQGDRDGPSTRRRYDADPAAAAGTPRVAAKHDADASAASSTSRKTCIGNAKHTGPLFRDQHAVGGVFVEIAEERIASRI